MTATPLPQFGASNQAYLPPPVAEEILASQHSAKPLDAVTLNKLAKKFADGVPQEEFSVAALQGCKFFCSASFIPYNVEMAGLF
jgi:chaperone BCS1